MCVRVSESESCRECDGRRVLAFVNYIIISSLSSVPFELHKMRVVADVKGLLPFSPNCFHNGIIFNLI